MINYFNEETKYLLLYFAIISNKNCREKLLKTDKDYIYYENHHILPRSIFPEYEDLNLFPKNGILLTAREHFICHLLLVKHYKKLDDGKNYRKMSKAFNQLSNTRTINSKKYQYLKLNLSHSDETKIKISEKAKGRKASKETKMKMSKSRTGLKRTEGQKKTMSLASKGILKTEKHKLNMRLNHADVSADKNPAAREILIFDNNDNVVFTCHGNFKKICKENNLPAHQLQKSYLNEGSKIYTNDRAQNIKRLENSGMLKYRFWYAKYK